MSTWDIAKLLIESCNSPEDVASLIGTLDQPDAAKQISNFMAPFASYDPYTNSQEGGQPAKRESEVPSTLGELDIATEALSEMGLSTISRDSIAAELHSIFRSIGMTNMQVEQWIQRNFGIELRVSKDALRKYLVRVLASSDAIMVHRISNSARQLQNNVYSSTKERQPRRSSQDIALGFGPSTTVTGQVDSSDHLREVKSPSPETTAAQLEVLFRATGMTNKQVEEWIIDEYGTNKVVGKDSLSKYLNRVLLGASLGQTNRLLSAAQRLAMNIGSTSSDIREYWDQLDKHFAIVE